MSQQSLMLTDHAVPVGSFGGSASVAVNASGGAVYYSDTPQVSSSNNQGSITPGSTGTLTGNKWITSAGVTTSVLVTITSIYDQWGQVTLPIFAATASLDVSKTPYNADTSGTFDASAAINQAIIDAASAPTIRSVFMPAGSYKLTSAIVPANGVSLIGAGPGTVLLPTGPVSAILLIGDSTHYLTDVTFRNFKVDGAGQTGGYNVATKGIQCPWVRRVIVDSVQVQNTIATGIALDFPDQCAITNCFTLNTGRLWTAGQPGGAGIGIGVSDVTSPDQTMIVANNHCYASGSYGIFFEAQDTFVSNLTPGIRITGNYCSGGKMAGIGVSGGLGVIVEGNTCSANGTAAASTSSANIAIDAGTLSRDSTELTIIEGNFCIGGLAHGICVVGPSSPALPRWCKVSNNMVYLNGGTSAQAGHGIFLNAAHALVGISVDGNMVTQNKQGGIVVAGATACSNIAIRNNDVHSNGQTSGTTTDGIQIGATVAGLEILDNQVYKQGAIGNQVTGINLLTGNTITNAKIAGNDVRGNGTNSMLIAATVDGTVIIRDNPGFNPVGVQSPAVPATGVAVAASQYDRMFYVTAGASTCTCAISGGPSPVIPSGAFGTVRVPAGQTLTPTYASAPTWVVEAE